MNTTRIPSATGTTAPQTAPYRQAFATCPLCHTPDASLTEEALQAGADWRCVRCGQRMDAGRLARIAAYAAWVLEHDNGEPAAATSN